MRPYLNGVHLLYCIDSSVLFVCVLAWGSHTLSACFRQWHWGRRGGGAVRGPEGQQQPAHAGPVEYVLGSQCGFVCVAVCVCARSAWWFGHRK